MYISVPSLLHMFSLLLCSAVVALQSAIEYFSIYPKGLRNVWKASGPSSTRIGPRMLYSVVQQKLISLVK